MHKGSRGDDALPKAEYRRLDHEETIILMRKYDMHPKSLSNFWGAYQGGTAVFNFQLCDGIRGMR